MSALAICSTGGLTVALSRWRPDIVMHFTSPSRRAPHIDDPRFRHFWFDDIEAECGSATYGHTTYPRSGAKPEQVARMIAVARLDTPRLLIGCTAGLSRSPAAAIITLCARGIAPAAACSLVRRAHPTASPNRWMLALADRALGLDGGLTGAAAVHFVFRRGADGAAGESVGFVALSGGR